MQTQGCSKQTLDDLTAYEGLSTLILTTRRVHRSCIYVKGRAGFDAHKIGNGMDLDLNLDLGTYQLRIVLLVLYSTEVSASGWLA
jgi:hypothetical protein